MTALPRTETDSQERKNHSFRALLRNEAFRRLWLAQLISQTAHNGIHYVELLMIARLTNSTGHVGIMILAFTLPAVLFSAIAGVLVDRLPKRRILVSSNVARIITALSYIIALKLFSGQLLLFWVYGVTFLASAIAQFFAPAEGAMIPLLVERRRLITANSLFNLTITGTQVLGLLVLFPFVIKIGDRWLGKGNGIEFSFALVAIMYTIASYLLSKLPPDPEQPTTAQSKEVPVSQGAIRRTLDELREGWRFMLNTPTLWVPIVNLSVTATVAMILAMMAPQFATEILRVSQEDAIYIFAPVGVGMLLGTFSIPRFSHLFQREQISNTGLLLQGVVLFFMGSISAIWGGSTAMTLGTMGLTFALGIGFAMIGIPAQTMLQERTVAAVRGRVFSVQFLLANLLSIPPLLSAGTLADRVGIPPVMIIASLTLFLLAGWSIFWAARHPAQPLSLDEMAELHED
ncbi:MAG: MFS transporter [Ardenticatenales bacterium]|nr:MFS transporter [Ardenticatenales bacterium]